MSLGLPPNNVLSPTASLQNFSNLNSGGANTPVVTGVGTSDQSSSFPSPFSFAMDSFTFDSVLNAAAGAGASSSSTPTHLPSSTPQLHQQQQQLLHHQLQQQQQQQLHQHQQHQQQLHQAQVARPLSGTIPGSLSTPPSGVRSHQNNHPGGASLRQTTPRQASSVMSGSLGGQESEAVVGPYFPEIPQILPHEKVFPIQIGSELFRLSGASISSDAPSYFSQFFEQQLANESQNEGPVQVRTLYIDRDPMTFRDIARHLQGYHVSPTDAQHFVRLFADAQFYSLPKLISQLYDSEFFIYIGGQPFRIPRDIFSGPGDHPNFFDLNISVNFSNTNEVFPGLNREGLLRPPSILPPSVPNHSAETFKELLHYLRGYPINIRSETHRQELLRDCKYYNFKGLEQKLIHHSISFNYFRNKEEIIIRLEDIKPSRIAFAPDNQHPTTSSTSSNTTTSPAGPRGWVIYGRPYVDDVQRELIVEIGSAATKLDTRAMRAEFTGKTNQRITSFFQCIANKLNLPTTQPLGLLMMQNSVGRASVGGAGGGGGPTLLSPGATPLSEDRVKVRIERDCWIMLDGEVLGERERESLFGVGNGGSNGINNGTGGGMSLLGGPDTEEDILFQQQQMQMHQLAVNTTGSNSPGVAAGAGNIWPHHPHQQHQLQHQLSPQQQQQSPLSAQHRRNNQTQIPNPPPKRRRVDSLPPGPSSTTSDDLGTAGGEWMIKKGQWRVRVQSTQNLDGKGGLEVVLCAVRIEAWRGEWGRNGDAGWLI